MAKRKTEKPVKTCQNCGITFPKNPQLSLKQWDATRFCSIACRSESGSAAMNARRPPLRTVFAERYEVDPITGCWNWNGTLSTQGYGQVRWRGKLYRAHMLALELAGTPRPAKRNACHHCDNRRCVNPFHLYWGTAGDNVRDASARGRLRTGDNNHNSRLSADAVAFIRCSDATNTELGRLLGVSRQAVRAIRIGKNWRGA